jgi:PAS domain S-box-containing protein
METRENPVRVLLVEDSPSDAQLLCEYLGQYPLQAFEVQRAECLAEAVDLSRQSTFDVTLLDLTLPDSSGLETCVRMREAARGVPIIVLTGVDDETTAWEAMHEGIEDYLVKGEIQGSSLARAIRYAVERSRTQQALRESEARLKLAQQSAGAGVWTWDMRMGKLHWSPELFLLFGLDPSKTEETFDVWRGVLHPEDRPAAEARIEQAVQDHLPLKSEYRIVLGTGETRWINALGNTVYDDRGQAQRMSGICIDITERKQMEAELRQLNERLEEEVAQRTEQLTTTIDHLQEEVARRVVAEGRLRENSRMLEGFFQHAITPLAFLDRRLDFVRVNAAYANANRRLPGYFIGKNYSSFYPDEEDQAIFQRVVQMKQSYHAHAKPSSDPRDPQRMTYWNWQLTPLLGETGEVQYIVFNLEDVTERETAYQELEHRTYQLQRLALELSQVEDRERRRLAEILHDDLQQVLAGAKFHLSILSNRIKGDETLREFTDQLNAMIKEAIAKSRDLSHELCPAVLRQGDLADAFEWLAQQVQTTHGLAVHVETRGSVALQSDTLKAFLYRAAQEILFNVVKHARVRDARLRLQRRRRQIWLTIADRGQGFDPQTLGTGDGFGLFGIRERVELLGGRMKIRSARGQGSTFLIAVPDAETDQTAALAAKPDRRVKVGLAKQSRPESPGGRRVRVLLADDHEVVREGLAALLEDAQDIEVVGHAGNGREAVDLACELEPDVVVMDTAMSVMACDEATRQIKLHLPKTRVVALSMFEEAHISQKMRRAGAEIYLLKTTPVEQLVTVIRGPQPASLCNKDLESGPAMFP